MFEGLGTEVNSIIETLCSKFGTTVEALIPELIKWKIYSTVGTLVMTGILIIFFITITIVLIKICYDKTLALVTLVAISLPGVIFLVELRNLIIWLNAPQGAAFMYVIQQLKK